MDWKTVIERIEVLAGRDCPPHVTILQVREAIRAEGLQHASSDEVEAFALGPQPAKHNRCEKIEPPSWAVSSFRMSSIGALRRLRCTAELDLYRRIADS